MDEARCLERLVEQRSHRISYTRLLSWEEGPAKPTRLRRKWKNRKPETLEVQQDSSACIVKKISHRSDKSLQQSIETESMEYNTSAESESDDWSDESGKNDTDIDADSEENINKFNEMSNENEEFRAKDTGSNCSNSDKFNLKCKSTHSSQQTRAPSKKLKRKRRFKSKTYWSDCYPLPYIDDNLELIGVKEDIHKSDLSVRKKVPSLAELCLMSSKGLVSEKQEEENQVNGIKYKPITRWVHHIDKDGMSDKKVFLQCCRNIWNTELYMKRYANPNYCLSSVYTNRDVDNSYVSSLLGLSVGTKVCFDISMPYVYWSRGELKLATDHFLALVQTERRGRIKALYINELARMHAHIGEGDLAARFYRMASDVAQEKFRDCTAADQISGILNEEKARKSKSHWNSIISSLYFHKEGSERAFIEAMLCFHGYWWTGEHLSWLQVAADCLKELVESYPDLHYHLACVYSFMGSFIEAEACIKKSDYQLPSCNTIPKDITISAAMRNWGCLTSFNTRAIPHLNIMWRTQLCHPSYVSESGMEVDVCPQYLHFRLNQEGCITGDMQMCLPPIRAVCLNPHTGDEDGITVHMKQQSFSYFESYYRKNTNKFITRNSMVFNWKNREGLTEKFNLFSKIQDLMYKETKIEILQKVILDEDNPQQYKQDALKYLDVAYKHGHSLTINECMQHVAFLKGRSTLEYFQMTHVTSGFKPKHKISIYGGPVIYGKCLLFLIRYGTDHKDIIRVIIRCADRESFKSPIIHKLYMNPGRISIEESYRTVGAKLAWCAESGDILERDENVIHLAHNINIHLLETKMTKTDEGIIYRIVLHAETLLLVMEISEQQSSQFYEASITTAIHLPGYPTDFCFVSRNAGFLVSWRHEKEIVHKYSRQHLFHFSTEGQLLGTIPFLGDSPFSFFPVFLDGDPNIQEKYPGYGTPGWYVYMRDGHGGILCIKLLDFH
ncbi:Hypothetical predicted protein [Mytilus galloprovincialis]|uniref:Uncharacterized protein n=1 Tax=Mytilus galloprovincialis TaxID=29158 RepID=A0A8B6CZM6_MYTGA|nr:Hypothetical predicted protein [Mytilus galloprovincialis]